MGRLWRAVKRFSVWRVPHYFMESNGAFLGEQVREIDRLNKLRFRGRASRSSWGRLPTGNHTPEGNWVLGLLISVVTAILVLPAVSLCLIFRAGGGHPLLPLIVVPVVAAETALMMNTAGSSGLAGVPGLVGTALAWGGTVTIALVSVRSAYILRRRYPDDFPFRNGPLRHPAAASSVVPG